MKRIGILTFSNVINYGAALQAYALKNVLEKMGYDASIVNYSKRYPSRWTNLYMITSEFFRLIGNCDIQGGKQMLMLLGRKISNRAIPADSIEKSLQTEKKEAFNSFWNSIGCMGQYTIQVILRGV